VSSLRRWSQWKPGPSARAAGLLLLILTVFPDPSQAQAVRGRVIDDDSTIGIDGATVTLLRYGERGRRTFTDSTGHFFLELPGRGPYRIEASRIGYATSLSRQFVAELTDTITVEFRLNTEAVILDPLVVRAVDGRGRSRFERHMEEWGQGVFISPEMVDSINPEHPADLLANREDTHSIWGWSAKLNRAIPDLRTLMGNGCLAYMVDFFPVTPTRWDPPIRGRRGSQFQDPLRNSLWETSALEHLKAEDIVAVEFYRFIGEVPDELKHLASRDHDISGQGGLSGADMCGLVVFWTRWGW